jgi:hypothetical protein
VDHLVVGQWACLLERQPDAYEVKGHLGGMEDREVGVDMEGNGQSSQEDTDDQVSPMVLVETPLSG